MFAIIIIIHYFHFYYPQNMDAFILFSSVAAERTAAATPNAATADSEQPEGGEEVWDAAHEDNGGCQQSEIRMSSSDQPLWTT